MNEKREKARKIATEFVSGINKKTFCKLCGRQPIEWHKKAHEKFPNSRVSSLRTQGASIQRIKLEIDSCEPLCRSCHMKIDGRTEALIKSMPYKKGHTYVEKIECFCCKKFFKPLRNGMCSGCDNHRSGRRVRKTKSCDGCFLFSNNKIS
jgi:hypothetical protein